MLGFTMIRRSLQASSSPCYAIASLSRITITRSLHGSEESPRPADVQPKPRMPIVRESPQDRWLRDREERRKNTMHGFYQPWETDDAIMEASEKGQEKRSTTLPTDVIIFLQKRYDFTFRGFRLWRDRVLHAERVKDQVFNPKRHAILGPDLATAHFVTFRKGKVKVHGFEKWIEDDKRLPKSFDARFKLKAVDCEDIDLLREGLDNLLKLQYLEELCLKNCSKLNDFGFDKLFRMYRHSKSLNLLDVSGCSGFSERSLGAAHRIPSLKEIRYKDTAASKYEFRELVELMLLEINPEMNFVH